MDAAGCRVPADPHSGHSGTISITIRMRRSRWNAMKPRIQRVLTEGIVTPVTGVTTVIGFPRECDHPQGENG